MSRVFTLLFVGALWSIALAPSTAIGQGLRFMGYGFRIGASIDDDLTQFLVGGQLDLGRLGRDVRFQPMFNLGFGDDALSILFDAEAHYMFPIDRERSTLQPYLGGGLGISSVDFDNDRRGGGDKTEVVLALVGGVEVPVKRWWSWFAEARFLVGDSSIFRLEGGVNWVY